MATIISTKTSGVGGLSVTGDASGVLELASADGTTAVTIDASQNVGIGVTPSALVSTGGGSGNIAISGNLYTTTGINLCSNFQYLSGYKFYGTGYAGQNYFDASTGGMYWRTSTVSGTAGNTVSWSNPAMTLDASGNLLVGTTSQAYGTSGRVYATPTSTSVQCFAAASPNSFTGINYVSDSLTTASTAWIHFLGQSGNGSSITTNNVFIYGNGNITNTNNSYAANSDVKLKENIVDATPKLDDLCKVKIRNYNLKSDLGYENHKQIGVIAQELEVIFPSMVEETPDIDMNGNDLGTTTKSVKYSLFTPMLIKAIQELNTKFEEYKASHP